MGYVLTVEDISGGYGDRTIVQQVSLDVATSERLLVIGPNGCGKTTLFKLMAGTLAATSGRVLLAKRDVTSTPTHLRMQMGMGYLPQTRNIFPSLTVEENLRLSFWYGNGEYAEKRDRLLEVFAMLKGKLARRAGLLSGGERQALAVSMAMMRPVKVLLLDEPTAGLAPKAAEDILWAIHDAQEMLGFASITVEHNLRIVSKWASRVLIMKHGDIVAEEHDPTSLLDNDWLQKYYFE